MRYLFLILCFVTFSMVEAKSMNSDMQQNYVDIGEFFDTLDARVIEQLNPSAELLAMLQTREDLVVIQEQTSLDTNDSHDVIFPNCFSAGMAAFMFNPTYAKNLPIRHFVLTEKQMAQFFSKSPPKPEVLNFDGLAESNLYFIIQIKNTGARCAFGTLKLPFLIGFSPISVDIADNTNEFLTYVIPLGTRAREDFEGVDNPCSELRWNELFVEIREKADFDSIEFSNIEMPSETMPFSIFLSTE